LKYIKKINVDNTNGLIHLSDFISNHYFNNRIETKKLIKSIKPNLKTKKVIYLNDTLSIIFYNYLQHPFIDKYLNALGKDITYESPYEVNFINLSPSLNQAFIYLHVPCGNGYYPTFVTKENNEWKITNLIEFIQEKSLH
jgi:hypothetical protein